MRRFWYLVPFLVLLGAFLAPSSAKDDDDTFNNETLMDFEELSFQKETEEMDEFLSSRVFLPPPRLPIRLPQRPAIGNFFFYHLMKIILSC